MMGLDSLLCWPVLLFGAFIHFVVMTIKKIVKRDFPTLDAKVYWKEEILPVLPSVVGVLLTLVLATKSGLKYPLPGIIVVSYWSKTIFGIVLGACASTIFRICKAMIKRIWGVDVDTSSTSPPPGPTDVVVVVPSSGPPPVITPTDSVLPPTSEK